MTTVLQMSTNCRLLRGTIYVLQTGQFVCSVQSCSSLALTSTPSSRRAKPCLVVKSCCGGDRQHTRPALRSPRTRSERRKFNKTPVSRGGKCCLEGRRRRRHPGVDRSGSEFIDAIAADVEQIEYINPFRRGTRPRHGDTREAEHDGESNAAGRGKRATERNFTGARGGSRLCRIHRRQSIDPRYFDRSAKS